MIKLLLLFALLNAVSAHIRIDGVSRRRGVTWNEMKAILDEHNALRSRVARGYKGLGPAANMLRMQFSRSVQAYAQKQASWCNGPSHGHNPGEGQNFANNGDQHEVMKGAMKGWFFDELRYYRYGGRITKRNAHLTQMIWANSYKLGCGAQKCRRVTRFVCNFKPAGNIRSERPYKKGRPCSACPSSHPFCLNALCSTAKQCRGNRCRCTMKRSHCKRGRFNHKNCTCKCHRGYTGRYCNKRCMDKPGRGCYSRARQGECKSGSRYHKDMMENCQASCKLCKPKCFDVDKQCDLFERSGDCYKDYVRGVCAKTCGYC